MKEFKKLIERHPIAITFTTLLDLFCCIVYAIWAEAVHAPASMLDVYAMIGIIIDAIVLIVIGNIHKEWFFK